MAVSKAVSGGPVYLSDAPTEFDPDAVNPLCYTDGKLLRPLAPAAPLPDSVFLDPYRNPVPYRVIAPLANGSAAIVVYNIKHANEAATFTASVSPADYTHANAMIQPYPGKRKIPAEGLILYDWYAEKAQLLEKSYTFDLTGLEDRLIQLSPIVEGWAVIGRADKYLAAAAVRILEINENSITIKMIEPGPLTIWTGQGLPKSQGLRFIKLANNLYKADIPADRPYKGIRITR